jgi:UDP-N-acetylmuramoylalanine--D-glutamate ligase
MTMPIATPWTEGVWRRVLVYGLGLSGRAATALLRRQGIEVVAVDRRDAGAVGAATLAADPGVELLLGSETTTLPAGIDGVVLSPGVPADRPLLLAARAAGIPIIAEVELAFPYLEGPVVAITGSNGKSTTTALTGAILTAARPAAVVCGNFGTPLSACVDGPPGRVFVVELSSFQLESTERFRPAAAALLNVSPDHLDRYSDLDAYAAAKRRLFLRQRGNDVAVLNADDATVAATQVACRRRFFSATGPVSDGCYVDGDTVIERAPDATATELFRRADLQLAGLHNLENAMAAALLARALGVGPGAIREGLRGFAGLPHRMERVLERAGVVWYDDSKGTNIGATERSLLGFPDRTVHLILGGRNKGADPTALRAVVGRKAKRLYLIGEAAADFAAALADLVPAESVGTLASAVERAAQTAVAGDFVVLSPACASFDQFRDFNDRGDRFQSLVRARRGVIGGG